MTSAASKFQSTYICSLTSIRKTLFFLAEVTRSFTCFAFIAKGFSHNTFFPASRNSWPTCQCSVCSTPRCITSVGTRSRLSIKHLHEHIIINSHSFELTNVWVVGQLFIAAVSFGNSMFLGKLFGSLQAPWCNGCYLYRTAKKQTKNTQANINQCYSVNTPLKTKKRCIKFVV